jgi:hypothetical protein
MFIEGTPGIRVGQGRLHGLGWLAGWVFLIPISFNHQEFKFSDFL